MFKSFNVVLTFDFLTEPRRPPALEESEISLVRLFNVLSEEQSSYRVIANPEQFHRHSFYPAAMMLETKSTLCGKIV